MSYIITFFDKSELYVNDDVGKWAIKQTALGTKTLLINKSLYNCAGISKIVYCDDKPRNNPDDHLLLGNNITITRGVSPETLAKSREQMSKILNLKPKNGK